jgi:hypothetical protein
MHHRFSCLETVGLQYLQNNTNLYLVVRIIVKIQKDPSTRTQAIAQKPCCLQTDDDNNTIT